jgi:hypothetical protein
MRGLVVAVALLGLVGSAQARPSQSERRALAATLLVLGSFATAAGTIVAIVWDQQLWSVFGCELGGGIAAFGGTPANEDCGHVDNALIPTGAVLVGVGQAAVITGSVLLRF